MQLLRVVIDRARYWKAPYDTVAAGETMSPTSTPLWIEEALLAQTSTNAPISHTGIAIVVCTYQRAASLKRFLNSLAAQDRRPDELIIVDASDNSETDEMLRQLPTITGLADRILYARVSGVLKGITHQRNFALRLVSTDLVAFFDDDVELLPHCLREMERVHREAEEPVAGVGAFMRNQAWPLSESWTWRTRLRLGLVPNLQPGRYYRSGISIPWNVPEPGGLIEGDWLPGCAMMWKTAVARATSFYEGFEGYAQGEDLEFSLRARAHGKLLVSGAAQVIHFYEVNGRPMPFDRGHMAVYNRYLIHRRALPERDWRDIAWFSYALAVDTLLLGRYIVVPSEWRAILLQIAGRLKAIYDNMNVRVKRTRASQLWYPLARRKPPRL